MKCCCITRSCVYERRLENGLRTKVSHRRKTETTQQLPLVSARPFFCPLSYDPSTIPPRHKVSVVLWWLRGAEALVKNSSFWWLKARITNFTNSRFHLSRSLSTFHAGICTNKIFMFPEWRWRTSVSHSFSAPLIGSIAPPAEFLSLPRIFLARQMFLDFLSYTQVLRGIKIKNVWFNFFR